MISFDNVGFRYGVGPEILHDVSVSIEAGSFHFLTGASGAGKTTLLNMMHLGLRPTRGFLSVMGEDVGTLKRRKFPASSTIRPASPGYAVSRTAGTGTSHATVAAPVLRAITPQAL